jgi:hypothetical protein
MFELRAKRVGPAEIARCITTEFGLPPRRNGNYSAKRWHADTITKMITARVYVQAGVVSQELFAKANTRLDRRGGPRTKVHFYPLSGSLRCPCGSRIHGARGGTKEYDFTLYYVCANRNKAHEPNPYHPAEDLEAQFAAFLHTFAKTPALRALVANRNGDDTQRRAELQATLDALHRDLATVRRRKERLLQDLEDEDDDAVRRELRKRLSKYARQEASFDRQQREAQDALAVLAAQADSTEDRERTIMLADELWAEASPEGRKELAGAVAAAMHGPLIVDENGILESDLLAKVATAKRLARRKLAKTSVVMQRARDTSGPYAPGCGGLRRVLHPEPGPSRDSISRSFSVALALLGRPRRAINVYPAAFALRRSLSHCEQRFTSALRECPRLQVF